MAHMAKWVSHVVLFIWSGAKERKSCRSTKMLQQNVYQQTASSIHPITIPLKLYSSIRSASPGFRDEKLYNEVNTRACHRVRVEPLRKMANVSLDNYKLLVKWKVVPIWLNTNDRYQMRPYLAVCCWWWGLHNAQGRPCHSILVQLQSQLHA